MRTQGKPAMATPKENMKMKMKETMSQEVVELEMGRDMFASLWVTGVRGHQDQVGEL